MGKISDNINPKLILTPVDPADIIVPAGDQALVLDSTDSDTLKLLNDSGTVTEIGGGGTGGTGSTVKDPRWNVLTGQTSIDEFNDSSLAGAWTRIDKSGGTGRATWTEDADVLSVYNPGGDSTAELHAQMRALSSIGGALSVGDGFVTCAHLSSPLGASLALVGLTLADGATAGAGTQAAGHLYTYSGAAGGYATMCDKFTNYQTQSINGTTTIVGPMGPVYLRLALIATNSYRLDASPDGVSWIKGSATTITSFTPTHVGVHCSSWGSSQTLVGSFEFLRRVAGVS